MTVGVFKVKPGQSVRFEVSASELGDEVDDLTGLTLTLQPPKRATDAPIVDAAPVNDGDGDYHSDQVIPLAATPGTWVRRWQAAGSGPSGFALVEILFEVEALAF